MTTIETMQAYMDNKDSVIKGLCKQITELEEGACRFHCRTARNHFEAGYKAAFGYELTEAMKENMTEAWCRGRKG